LVERSAVLLLGGRVDFAVYEEVGSGTQTVRVSARGYVALLLRQPAGVAK
jgi:hypothetical protein